MFEFQGQALTVVRFSNRDDLRSQHPTLFEAVQESVFKMSNPDLASLAEDSSGTILRGDVHCAHSASHELSSFEELTDALDDYGDWLIIDGTLTLERSLGLVQQRRVVVLGDLVAVGVANIEGELIVEGKTTITGGLMIDSGQEGFTQLRLAAPAGFIATTSNFFDVPLDAAYFYDPLFECGFEGEPTTAHEQVIQAKFGDKTATVLTLDDLVAFFTFVNAEMGQEVLAGAANQWLEYLVVKLNSAALKDFFDKRQAART